MNLTDVVVVSACRTAMGKFGGTLKNIPSYDLGAIAIKEAIKRANIDVKLIDEVILGSCRQAGNGPNPARTAMVNAGIPIEVPAVTINMACPSGMRTIAMASQSIRLGEAEIIVAGGFENMSSIPYLLKNARWDGFKMGNKVLEDGWSDSIDPLISQGMGETAENICDKYKISRQEQDNYALNSHLKASAAQKNGSFDEEIVSVEIKSPKVVESTFFVQDETIRNNINLNDLTKIKPAFRKDGTVTAGNSCGLSDGATSLIVTSRKRASELGLKPLFSIISFSQLAVSPAFMGEGPAFAIPLALKKAGMTIENIDLVEINEAFAVQVISNQKALNINPEKLNIHGGAIALGHPTGISGARILTSGYYALKQTNKEFCVASICGGGGVTMAVIIKREN